VNNVRFFSISFYFRHSLIINRLRRGFPKQGKSRYETVNACLRWKEDELGVQEELCALETVFQDYGFLTNVFLIPKLYSLRT
jgi:hypothetical protein